MSAAWRVELSRPAAKAFNKLDRAVQRRVAAAIDGLSRDPRPPGARKLVASDGLWRVRVGDYRLVYTIQDDVLVVLVVRVAHRCEVYDR